MDAEELLNRYAEGDRYFRAADLSEANLSVANLSGANLSGADLSEAKLSGAKLSGANLSAADLSGAKLRAADLRGANLSGAKGLLDPIEFLGGLEAESGGLVVYKTFNAYFAAPPHWRIRPGEVLTENVLHDRTLDCGCGVNVSTRQWQIEQGKTFVWKCLIEWAWLVDVCVPYHTGGKFRAGRVRLIEEVELKNGDE